MRIRQNNLNFRLIDFSLWFSYGVLKKSVFGIQEQKFYYCKMALQVLTAQYPLMYTYKFRVHYSDFTPITTSYGKLLLKSLPAGTQVIAVLAKTQIAFAGTSFVGANFRLKNGLFIPAADAIDGDIFNYNQTSNVGEGRAKLLTPLNSQFFFGGQSLNVTCNFTTPTNLYLTIKLAGSAIFSGLSAGAMDFWIMTAKFK